MKNTFSLLLIIQIVIKARLAIISSGPCPTTPILSSFDTLQVRRGIYYFLYNITSRYLFHSSSSKYVGKWYGISGYPVYYTNGYDCLTATYGYVNSTQVTVYNHGIDS
jgi:hypothetical protein